MQTVQCNGTYFSYPGCYVKLDESRLKILFTVKSTACLEIVAREVCKFMNVDSANFHKVPVANKTGKSKGSNALISLTRQLYCYLAKNLFPNATMTLIGKIVYHEKDQRYDHTSVIHSIKNLNDKLYTEEISKEMISYLKYNIKVNLNEIWKLYQSELRINKRA